jgi:SM-20-related protein
MGALVDLEALAGARLETTPYEWAYLPRALHRAAADELRATFPERGFWRLRDHDGEKSMDYRLRALVPLGAERAVDAGSLAPVWRRFAAELLSPAYREASEQGLGRSLDGAPLEVSAWRWGPDSELGPHADIPRKLASQVFYFNEAWDPGWGGCLRILGSKDVEDTVAELPPALGSASIIVRSDSSWHAVPRVRGGAAEPRLSVVATWQHPGTGSPFWTVERDGSVRCHARGSAPA